MPYKIFAKCPVCQKEAKSLYDIEKLFGLRFLEKITITSNYDGWVKPSKMKKIGKKTIPQSNCRKCRTKNNGKVIRSSRRIIRKIENE